MTIDGYNISYKETGDGKQSVIILQGWGTDMSVYDSIAKLLSAKYRVIQFDMPGFGSSGEPRSAWSVDDYTDFFIKFVNALGIDKSILIGHSYGGRVIIKLANRDNISFEIDRIILIDSAGIMPHRTSKQKAKVARYKFMKKIVEIPPVKALFPDLIEQWKSRQGSSDYRNASPIMRQCLVKSVNEDLTDLLPSIKQEVLLIWGDRDTATPLADGQKMEKLLANAGLAVIKGAGHYSFLDNPIVFANIMKSYLKLGDK